MYTCSTVIFSILYVARKKKMNTKNEKINNEQQEQGQRLDGDDVNILQEKQTPENIMTTAFLILFFGFILSVVMGSFAIFGDTPGFIIDIQGIPAELSYEFSLFLVGGFASTIVGTIIFIFYEY
jgi:hypothetical protein